MNLEGCYAECVLPRAKTAGGMIAKSLIIAGVVASGFGTLMFFAMGASLIGFLTLIIAVACVLMIIYLFPRFDIVWEYVFVDGQLDFDQILGGNGRKRKKRVDFETLEVLAPKGSRHLDNFKNMQATELDYSSLMSEKGYILICHEGNNLIRIFFEPNEEMISLMKGKSPRKVFTD